MVQINFASREISCKIVYYGPGLSGKTTNIEKVFEKVPGDRRGKLTSIATEGDRTLFFDFLPLELGTVAGMKTKFQIYTVPGQVYYNSTRKLVLRGADGVVFVADSQKDKMEENLESLQNLEDNLREHGFDIEEIPLVIQWNKRDLPDITPVADMSQKLNKLGVPTFEAVAVKGEGVMATLKGISGLVLEKLNRDLSRPKEAEAAAPLEAPRAASPLEKEAALVAAAEAPAPVAATAARPPETRAAGEPQLVAAGSQERASVSPPATAGPSGPSEPRLQEAPPRNVVEIPPPSYPREPARPVAEERAIWAQAAQAKPEAPRKKSPLVWVVVALVILAIAVVVILRVMK